jgi:hypothetical protein
VFILDLCGNLNSCPRISAYRQWIGKLKQLIGMIGEAYSHYFTKIRLYSAERAGDWGKNFSAPRYNQFFDRFSKVHNAEETSINIQCIKMTTLPHPPYSPELSPCDFWFFSHAKNSLRDEQFDDAVALLERLSHFFEEITLQELQSVFHEWIRRLKWVLWYHGEYFTKNCLYRQRAKPVLHFKSVNSPLNTVEQSLHSPEDCQYKVMKDCVPH